MLFRSTTIAQKKNEVGNFDEKLAAAQELAAEYQNTINAQNTIIAQENERIERERLERERLERERQERERAEAAAAAAAAAEIAARASSQEQGASTPANNGGSQDTGSGNDNGGEDGSQGNNGAPEESGGAPADNGGAPADNGGGQDPGYTTGISGSDVVNYALGFVGNPYVWGGKDPNTGADCSGFTSYVYAHFGISIPSYSYAQRSVGREVSYANAQPGDLICYSGHVAIYMGNGQIVHAKGTAYGICAYDNATYRSIITVRRLL